MIHRDHDYDGDKVQPQAAKPFKAPSAPSDNKKVTEFFAVRRSVRKTKKEVQEERMRNIEQAIREGREEGLAVSFKLSNWEIDKLRLMVPSPKRRQNHQNL